MSILISILRELEKAPATYLASPSIWRIGDFLRGSELLRMVLQDDAQNDGTLWHGFTSGLLSPEQSVNEVFARIAELTATSDEAVSMFFDEWNSYLASCRSIDDTDNQTQRSTTTPRLVDVTEILTALQKKPGMYLSSATIGSLKACISGILLTSRLGNDQIQIVPCVPEFELWLRNTRYGKETKCEWDSILTLMSAGNEVQAFKHFYSELELFLRSSAKKP